LPIRSERVKKKAALVAIALIALALIAVALSAYRGKNTGDTVQGAREAVLRQNLFTMRTLLDQYAVDLHRRPQSLSDLVTAGYLKELPTDPITGRNDTWILLWSKDQKAPGIENIRSGSHAISSKGTAYEDW
jgi:general secretion pathway protein G